jgi:POT family proton-dependent oligopeptide transporter
VSGADRQDAEFVAPPPGDVVGHPRALWMLFGSEFWERFAYYGMRALLAVYVATAFFATLPEGEARARASLTYGAYTALIYATGLFGGSVADRYLGYRHSILLGGAIMAIGLFLLLVPDLEWFLAGLAVLVVGNGLFKPNISAMVGRLYAPGDVRRDSGFTIFYMGINAGAALAPILCGTLIGARFGYQWGFLVAGLGIIVGLIVFQSLTGWLGQIGASPAPESALVRVFTVALGCCAVVPLVFFLLSRAALVGYLLLGFFAVLSIYFVASGCKSDSRVQLHRYIAMLLLFLAKILFWGMFEQAGSSLNFFARDHVAAPFDFTAFQSANPVFILLLAPLFAWAWPRLERSGRNPSIPRKFALALLFVALGFTVLVVSIGAITNPATKLAWQILALTYFLNTMGELCLSPIGLSMVSKLAAPRDTGLAMGAWFMCTAIGNYAAGVIAAVASGGGAATGLAQYASTYTQIAIGGFVLGIAFVLSAPLINRLMHGIK